MYCTHNLSSELTKKTCSRTTLSFKDQFVRSIVPAQHCTNLVYMDGKAKDPIAPQSPQSHNIL